MIELSFYSLLFLAIQYIGCTIVTSAASLFLLYKFKANPVTISLSLFGIIVSCWEVLVFFNRTAQTPMDAMAIFGIIGIVYPFTIGFYFLTFLNVWRFRIFNILCLLPSITGSLISIFLTKYQMHLGVFGWSYSSIVQLNTYEVILLGTPIYMGIMILILIYLLVKAPSRSLKTKFLYILLAFIAFQAVGITITNVYLIQINPNFPPLGGFLNLATFATVSYAIFTPPEQEFALIPIGYTKISPKVAKLVEAFYSNMTAPMDALGSKYFKLLSYLKTCGLDEKISFDNDKLLLNIGIKGGTIEAKNVTCLIDVSLTLLENGELDPKFSESLVSFIDQTFDLLGGDLIEALKKHENYLKEKQILSKASEGKLKLLFVPTGYTEKDMERFSIGEKMTHEDVKESQILLMFSARSNYPERVKDFVMECIANGEKLYVFTRKESNLYLDIKDVAGIDFLFLSPSTSKILKESEGKRIVPVSDLSQMLGLLITIKNSDETSAVIFDSLTDVLLLTSFEQTYKATRHALDIIANSKTHSMFLINKDVHDKNTLSAFEILFKVVLQANRRS
ncbi:MAG: hypothetical protein ABSB40_10940 [Nitrososphaeria archaeon]